MEETTTTTAAASTTTSRPGDHRHHAAPAETTTTTAAAPKEFVFGMLLVGPYNDHGWSQAHYEGGQYVEAKLPGAKMIYVDKVNTADRPGTTPEQLAEDLVNQGAKMIFFTSDDMKDGAVAFAKAHPDIPVEFTLRRQRLERRQGLPEPAQPEQHHGQDGIRQDDRRRRRRPHHPDRQDRLPRPADQRRDPPPGRLRLPGRPVRVDRIPRERTRPICKFTVNWIGFWFNIPGVTSDPTQVADNFFNQGYDVVISGIDTTEALVEAGKLADGRQEGLGDPVRLRRLPRRGPRRSPSVSRTSTGARTT